ncbi:hypothetical protein SteCoe_36464 [Stentor coeruleus]|uniref:Translin-associated factor X-interacting protein 1 N-terminal domain-containing protein n=1 Tax=Stentor coeruleus TaxID=5963 RepID=A0A1R2AQ73_9CILI|nr:hypothetical protein SteCoe_36464 [Stentor coeruleus]
MSQVRKKSSKSGCRKSAGSFLKNVSQNYSYSPYSHSHKLNPSMSFTGFHTKNKHILQNSLMLKSLHSNSSFVSPFRGVESKFAIKNTHFIKKVPLEERLEKKMLKELRVSAIECQFEIYEKYFSEVVRIDRKYGKLLAKIKSGYDQKIGYLSVQNIDELLEQIRELKEKVIEGTDERIRMARELEKSAKENLELSRSLDKTESLYLEVQEKLQKIYDTDLDNCQQQEINWKYIVSENKYLLKLNDKLKKESEDLHAREKQCVKLIIELKERGFPVREVYENMQESEKETVSPCSEHETDNEALISGKPVSVKRPSHVPSLNLDQVCYENSSSYESESESNDQ